MRIILTQIIVILFIPSLTSAQTVELVSSGTSGDAILKIESDTDNNNENDNSRIELYQDGGGLGAYIGFNSDWGGGSSIPGSQPDNIFRIGTRYSGVDYFDRLLINTANGNIGIGTSDPSSLIHLSSATPVLTIENSGTGNENQHEIFFKENSSTGMKINYNGSISGPLDRLEFVDRTSNADNIRAVFQRNGNVGIGTTSPESKLAVNGQIRATEVKVLADITVPDYVFEPNYKLRTLKETKEYIEENKHLPEIPSASEIGENGIDLGDMNMRLLKKIEELTLYQIELMEKLEQQNAELQDVKKELQELKK